MNWEREIAAWLLRFYEALFNIVTLGWYSWWQGKQRIALYKKSEKDGE